MCQLLRSEALKPTQFMLQDKIQSYRTSDSDLEMNSDQERRPRHRSRLRSISLRASLVIIAVVFALVVARLMLPSYLQRYVNRTINRIPGYSGHVGDIDVHLIRGAYTIKKISLSKLNGAVPVPLFSSPVLDLSIQWRALLEGKVVSKIVADKPELNFVASNSKKGAQLEVDSEWLDAVKDLFPLRINRFEIHQGQIHYRDFESTPKVDVNLLNVEAVGENFSNTRTPTKDSVAQIDATALMKGKSKVKVKSLIQPAEKFPTFKVEFSLEKLPIPAINDFLEAYAAVDAEGGSLSVYSEMVAENNRIHGYVKPLVTELSLLQLKSNPIKLLWEGVVAFFADILTNQRHDQLGTNITFEGRLDDPNINVWYTVNQLLRNAFVKALKPGTDNSVHFPNRS